MPNGLNNFYISSSYKPTPVSETDISINFGITNYASTVMPPDVVNFVELLIKFNMIYYILYLSDFITGGILLSNFKFNFNFLLSTGNVIIDMTSINNDFSGNS